MEPKSPCHTCELHEQGISKSSEECVKCEDRVEYVRQQAKANGVGPTSSSTVSLYQKQIVDGAVEGVKRLEVEEAKERATGVKYRQRKTCKESKPQTEEYFRKHNTYGTWFHKCNSCISKKMKKSRNKATPPAAPPVSIKKDECVMVVVKFKDHKDVYEKLKDAAKRDIRSVENQALYYIFKSLELIEKD